MYYQPHSDRSDEDAEQNLSIKLHHRPSVCQVDYWGVFLGFNWKSMMVGTLRCEQPFSGNGPIVMIMGLRIGLGYLWKDFIKQLIATAGLTVFEQCMMFMSGKWNL